MNRRNATTLTEVLIAIFIMGIGLMAILSLFPLGAVQMAQALKDQRSAEAAGNASALARVIWKQACDADLNTAGSPNNPPFRESTTTRQYPRAAQRFAMALDDPNFNDQSGTTPNAQSYPPPATPIPPGGFALPSAVSTGYYHMSPMPLSGPDADRSSYPVFVDMYGWNGNSSGTLTNKKWWLAHPSFGSPLPQSTTAGSKIGLIPRRPLYIKNPNAGPLQLWQDLGNPTGPTWAWNTTQRIYKQFSLLDDITFRPDGVPAGADGSPATARKPVERQGRYSWAYLFRRVRNQSSRDKVDVTIVVYSGRSLDVPSAEAQFYGIGQTDSRFLTIAYPPSAGSKPALKRGYWLLDATIFNNAGQPDPQGRFYRVVNVEDGPVTTAANAPVPAGLPTITVEVQTPLTYGPTVRIINVLSNVVEVFQVGEVAKNSPPRNATGDLDY